MKKPFCIVTFLNILLLLVLYLADYANNSIFSSLIVAKRWEEVPIYGLSFGSLLTIISFVLFLDIVRCGGRRGLRGLMDRVPCFWSDDERTVSSWKKYLRSGLLVLLVVFPLVAHMQFWMHFNEHQAWKEYRPYIGQEVGLWEAVPWSTIMEHGWYGHKYGELSMRNSVDHGGLWYVPLIQPALMALLSAIVLFLFLRICAKLFRIT